MYRKLVKRYVPSAYEFRKQAKAHDMIMRYHQQCPCIVSHLGRLLQEIPEFELLAKILTDDTVTPEIVWASLVLLHTSSLEDLIQFFPE